MSWTKLMPTTTDPVENIRFSIRAYRKSAKVHPVVIISGALAKTLGLNAGDNASVDLGAGENNAGKLRLRIEQNGPFKFSTTGVPGKGNAQSILIRLPIFDGMVPRKHGAETCNFAVVDRNPAVVEIDLPDWALKVTSTEAPPNALDKVTAMRGRR